jgi:hypothetical protein
VWCFCLSVPKKSKSRRQRRMLGSKFRPDGSDVCCTSFLDKYFLSVLLKTTWCVFYVWRFCLFLVQKSKSLKRRRMSGSKPQSGRTHVRRASVSPCSLKERSRLRCLLLCSFLHNKYFLFCSKLLSFGACVALFSLSLSLAGSKDKRPKRMLSSKFQQPDAHIRRAAVSLYNSKDS